jgi:hypothetical protein
MTRKAYGALGIIAIASILRIATASAGPCAGEITEFRSSLSQDKNGEPTFVGTAPQSIDAQLEHQPTRESVERAKKQAQAQILTVVIQAEAFDSQGKQNECRQALAKAKLLLNPGLQQDKEQRRENDSGILLRRPVGPRRSFTTGLAARGINPRAGGLDIDQE